METMQWTREQMRERRRVLEDRVERLRARRVEIADRIGLAVVAPAAVPADEVRALRAERGRLTAELDDLVDGLVVLRRMEADAASFGGGKAARP